MSVENADNLQAMCRFAGLGGGSGGGGAPGDPVPLINTAGVASVVKGSQVGRYLITLEQPLSGDASLLRTTQVGEGDSLDVPVRFAMTDLSDTVKQLDCHIAPPAPGFPTDTFIVDVMVHKYPA